MNALQLENAILSRLAALGIPARACPGLSGNYVPSVDTGEALVRYSGMACTSADLSDVGRTCVRTLKITLVSRDLRSPNGIYAWLGTIRAGLEGLVIPGAAAPLELRSEELIGERDGIWQFAQHWNIKTDYSYEQQDNYADQPLSAAH